MGSNSAEDSVRRENTLRGLDLDYVVKYHLCIMRPALRSGGWGVRYTVIYT